MRPIILLTPVCVCALGWATVEAGPEDAAAIREWCAPFVAVSGVDIEWRFEIEAPDGSGMLPVHRERLVCCWDEGLLLEIGGAIRSRYEGAVPENRSPPELVEGARVTAIGTDGSRVGLSWTPGSVGHPALERTEADLGREQIRYMFQSEYLIGNYLMTGAGASVLESAEWDGVGADARLTLDTGGFAFEWTRQGDGLRFTAITSYDQRGNPSFRQDFMAHAMEEFIACEIAHQRRMSLPAEASAGDWEYVNTAVLEEVTFLASVPLGFTELDTSQASEVDIATGIVYDDEGNETGRIILPQKGQIGSRWAGLVAVAGLGIMAGGGVWWWMRRRGPV